MGQVFVSYSRTDRDAVKRLVAAIEADGHVVQTDTSIAGGQLWREAIVRAIRAADVFVVVLSSRAVLSDEVRAELDIAADLKKAIVPILIERTDIPDRMRHPLAGKQWMDLSVNPESHHAALRAAVRAHVKPTWKADTKKAPDLETKSDANGVQLWGIVPGTWNVEIIAQSSFPLTMATARTERYVFTLEVLNEFTAAPVKDPQLKYRPFEHVKGKWHLKGDTTVTLTRAADDAPAYLRRKNVGRASEAPPVSYYFMFNVIERDELRGVTDFPLHEDNPIELALSVSPKVQGTVWRRA